MPASEADKDNNGTLKRKHFYRSNGKTVIFYSVYDIVLTN